MQTAFLLVERKNWINVFFFFISLDSRIYLGHVFNRFYMLYLLLPASLSLERCTEARYGGCDKPIGKKYDRLKFHGHTMHVELCEPVLG